MIYKQAKNTQNISYLFTVFRSSYDSLAEKTRLLIYFFTGSLFDQIHVAKTFKLCVTLNVLIIHKKIIVLTCYVVFFSPAGNKNGNVITILWAAAYTGLWRSGIIRDTSWTRYYILFLSIVLFLWYFQVAFLWSILCREYSLQTKQKKKTPWLNTF